MFDPDQLPLPDLGLCCRKCGYSLAYLQERRCPECGWSFTMDDLVPRGDFPPLFADGKQVRAEPDVVELLRQYQVPYVELTDPVSGVFRPIRSSRDAAGAIAVPRQRYLEAVDLLRRRKLGEPMPQPPPASGHREDWSCRHCGQLNPANFEICWSCGHDAAPEADDS
ncbi:MAG: hypothetical protein IT445_08970 [Phycisphaeraceae bacterium]|nr:hypothetical protein [Phycisphaeraceae bacterium]